MEEIEVLEYILSNLNIHQEMLYKILRKREVRDEIYNLIRENIIEYRKYILAIKKMLLTRNSKYKFENNILHNIASEIEANTITRDDKESLIYLRENSKISIMDIQKVKSEYNIKSKTILNLLNRIEKFEYNNLERISKIMQ